MIFVRRLAWEPWNVAHIARHGVTPEEVEEACHAHDRYTDQGNKGRIRLIGPSAEGRVLAVILDPVGEGGVYYPVTARPASRKGRQLYRAAKGGP